MPHFESLEPSISFNHCSKADKEQIDFFRVNPKKLYQPRMILENGKDVTLGKPVYLKPQALAILDGVKEHAKRKTPTRFPNLAFYIQEIDK